MLESHIINIQLYNRIFLVMTRFIYDNLYFRKVKFEYVVYTGHVLSCVILVS